MGLHLSRSSVAAAPAALLLNAGSRGIWALWTECQLEDVLDMGSKAHVLDDFWTNHVQNSSHIHIDSGTSLDEGRFFMRWAYIFTRSAEMVAEVAGNCLFGVLTVMLQAIPAIDYERGRAEALAMLHSAREIFVEASQLDGFPKVMSDAQALGWEVQSIYHALRTYEFFFAKPRISPENTCVGPKFYVYPPPTERENGETDKSDAASGTASSLLHAGPENYLHALMQRPLQCLFGMYGTELLFHHFFDSSPCRVSDPAAADFFFVPSYFKCIEVINYVDHFNKDNDEAAILFYQTMDYIKRVGPWFQKLDGADHIFLFSWGRFPCRLPNWRTSMRSAIALQVEDHCEDLNSEDPQPSFSRWKDIIIPGHIDHWRAFELQRWNRPTSHRDVLLAFHGRHSGNTDSYANVSVRSRIMEELEGMPGVSVGGFIEDYHELLGRSIFCLAPRGITPWTIHLFVAMLTGCIPVILSDHLEVPFPEFVDWQSFSIKWPEEKVGKDLYKYLSSMPVATMVEMKRQVDANACWFDYYSMHEGCSPYAAVLGTLQDRLLQRPSYVGTWWNPTDEHIDRHTRRPSVSRSAAIQAEGDADSRSSSSDRRWSLLWLGLPTRPSGDLAALRSSKTLPDEYWNARWQALEALGADLLSMQLTEGHMTNLVLDGALDFYRTGSNQASGSPRCAVASEAAAELLVPHLLQWALEDEGLDWHVLIWVQKRDFVPFFQGWAEHVNHRWGRPRPLVVLVTSDFEAVVVRLAQAMDSSAST